MSQQKTPNTQKSRKSKSFSRLCRKKPCKAEKSQPKQYINLCCPKKAKITCDCSAKPIIVSLFQAAAFMKQAKLTDSAPPDDGADDKPTESQKP